MCLQCKRPWVQSPVSEGIKVKPFNDIDTKLLRDESHWCLQVAVKYIKNKPGLVTYTCTSSISNMEAEGSGLQGHPGL